MWYLRFICCYFNPDYMKPFPFEEWIINFVFYSNLDTEKPFSPRLCLASFHRAERPSPDELSECVYSMSHCCPGSSGGVLFDCQQCNQIIPLRGQKHCKLQLQISVTF